MLFNFSGLIHQLLELQKKWGRKKRNGSREGRKSEKGGKLEGKPKGGRRKTWLIKKGDREDRRKREKKNTEMAKKAVHGILLGTA